MDIEVYNKLKEIQKEYTGQIFGQICQNLLALAFAEKFSSENVEVSNVEGIDIIINDKNNMYAIEVKTTSGEKIGFKKKDFDGLKKFQKQEYKPILAVLKLNNGTRGWIFHNAERFYHLKNNLSVNYLYTDDEYKELVCEIQKIFEDKVNCFYQCILNEGSKYLTNLLRQKGLK